jgi:RNA polymerase sigma-B factor
MAPTEAQRLEALIKYQPLKTNPESRPAIRQRDLIAAQNDRLALKIARRAQATCNLEFEDLAQLARIGLLKAIDRFDPAQGFKFSSFAVPYIRGEILHYLRDHGSALKIPRRWLESWEKVRGIQREMLKHGREISLEEIAMAEGIPAETWRDIADVLGGVKVVLTDSIDLLDRADETGGDMERAEIRQMAIERVSRLPLKMGHALTERLFRKTKDAVIAKQLGITVVEVRLLIEQGLKRIQQEGNYNE